MNTFLLFQDTVKDSTPWWIFLIVAAVIAAAGFWYWKTKKAKAGTPGYAPTVPHGGDPAMGPLPDNVCGTYFNTWVLAKHKRATSPLGVDIYSLCPLAPGVIEEIDAGFTEKIAQMSRDYPELTPVPPNQWAVAVFGVSKYPVGDGFVMHDQMNRFSVSDFVGEKPEDGMNRPDLDDKDYRRGHWTIAAAGAYFTPNNDTAPPDLRGKYSMAVVADTPGSKLKDPTMTRRAVSFEYEHAFDPSTFGNHSHPIFPDKQAPAIRGLASVPKKTVEIDGGGSAAIVR